MGSEEACCQKEKEKPNKIDYEQDN